MRVPDFFVFVKYRKFQNSKQIGLIAESRNEEKMSNCDSTNFWGVPVQASNVLSRLAHTCICFKDCLIVWGGYSNCFGEELYLYTDEIWIYHTKSGLWFVKKTEGDAPLQTSGATAILVHTDMYIFGGHQWHGHTNQLFKLDLLNLHWSKMYEEGQYEHLPSPRDKMAGWHYKHQLYFFGGFGFPTKGYMRKNGIYEKDVSVMSLGWNNQLIVFDLETQQWSDMPCKGSIPSPRAAYSADKIKNKVYLFGGRYKERRMNDFYCLDLDTLWWTELNSDGPVPTGRSWHTLTALSSNTLLLFGGFTQDQHPQDDAWIVNLRTVTWHELHGRTDLKPRLWHTAARNNEGDVYVFGGCQNNILQNNEPNIHSNEITVFRLNPHSLLSMCMDRVFCLREQTMNDWTLLPMHLVESLQSRYRFVESKSQQQGLQSNTNHGQSHVGSTCAIS